jgi:hypothetical protein
MTKVLAFDSMYMIAPFGKLYTASIRKILNQRKSINNRLVLYRLDKDNTFLRDERNVSGMAVEVHKDHIDALSLKFYKHLGKSRSSNILSMKKVDLYGLHTRQVKLKLASILICAIKIRKHSNDNQDVLEIITDRQTVAIMKEAFSFLNYSSSNITWKINGILTSCITVNSLTMRFASLAKMIVSPSSLPREYYYKHVDYSAPTVLITMPKRRPQDFFSLYIEEFSARFNILVYSMGYLDITPDNYKRIEIKRTIGALRGVFNIKNMCWTSSSYIADILLIYKNHANLSTSIDVVNSIFHNRIDAHISRLQTTVVDNHLASKARTNSVFILGDIFEEIYYCDAAVCSSKSRNTESVNLALVPGGSVAYKGSNSLINYRLKNFDDKRDRYLHKLLEVDTRKKMVFYASDPSKEESQRYLTEKFLFGYFCVLKEFVLVVKTHSQDNGLITHYAYLDSGKPENVILIGDIAQKRRIISKELCLFEEFDFNAAIKSCDGFLTASSSSILQALTLGIKAGIVDMFNNGYFDYLVSHKATFLVNSETSLRDFLKNESLVISEDALRYCGLKNENQEFDVGEHLLECLRESDKNNQKKYPKIN